MTATLLYRIASLLLVLFAVGHTVGFLKFNPPTPESIAVRDALDSVQFPIGNGKFTYGGFYRGFGLFCTAYLLFTAFLAWYLGGMAHSNPAAIVALSWIFFALQLASVGLSWRYFLVPPIVLSVLIAVCSGWASWLIQQAGSK
jgi:hypothetical protein